MKLHFISMDATTRQVPNDICELNEIAYRIFEFHCFEKGFNIKVDTHLKENVLDKLKDILKEEFEVVNHY